MGVSQSFFVVVGVYKKITDLIGDYQQTKSEPSCYHSEEERRGEFCSACGKKVETKTFKSHSQKYWDFTEYVNQSRYALYSNRESNKEPMFLLGHYRVMNPHDEGNVMEYLPNPQKAFNYITEFCEQSPIPILYKPRFDDVSMFMFLETY